jgi:hypothetical protein
LLRRFVAGLSSRRQGFDPGSVHMGFVVDKVVLQQVFPPVLRFSPVNFIPPVLHYTEKRTKLIIFITGLQGITDRVELKFLVRRLSNQAAFLLSKP